MAKSFLAILALFIQLTCTGTFGETAGNDDPFSVDFQPRWGLTPGFYGAPDARDSYLFFTNHVFVASKIGLSWLMAFHFRPVSRNTLIATAPSEYYIFREDRYILSTGVNETHLLNRRLGVYGEASIAYTFGHLNGSDREVYSSVIPILGAGITLPFYQGEETSFRFNIGYQFSQHPSLTEHSILISFPFFVRPKP